MNENGDSRKSNYVSIRLSEGEGIIEKLPGKESEKARIRISCSSQDSSQSRPLDVSEDQLVDLLHRAIRAGILSAEFLNNLHSEFEI